jgi:hypothetical protein
MGSEGVLDGIPKLAVLRIPLACPSVQRLKLVGLLVREVSAQDIGEQMVIAVPLPSPVKRHDEQVQSFERLELELPVVSLRDRVTQRAAQALQYGGLQEEHPDLFGLAA